MGVMERKRRRECREGKGLEAKDQTDLGNREVTGLGGGGGGGGGREPQADEAQG